MSASGKLGDAQSNNDFDVRPDHSANAPLNQHYPAIAASQQRSAGTAPLAELPVDNQILSQRQPLGPRPLPALPELKPSNRQRRPQIGTQTFRPLPELEGEGALQPEGQEQLGVAALDFATACSLVSSQAQDLESHPLTTATVERTVEEQVERQLRHQFDWVMTHPNSATQHVQGAMDQTEPVLYGCNLVRRKAGENEVDTYTFLTTRLDGDELRPPSEGQRELEDQVLSVLTPPVHAAQGNLRSKTSTDTLPRIEDSLEEIDRLEDEIEVVNSYAISPRVGKRVTIAAGASATVRIKPNEKIRPALRRSNSMDMRENQPQRINAQPEQKAAGSLSRSKSTTLRTAESNTPVKASKPATVSHYELPGEAVHRRLKQQREARQAQQAEAQKAAVAPPKPRSSKPLTRPTFELPGEAISRRKREEREAKLRAQEEEERKRREFKARPIRYSATSSLPRDTIASRARQGKSSEDSLASRDSIRSKPLSTSHSLSRLSAVSAAQSPQGRGRNSVAAPSDEGSRATSVSTNLSEKRSSVSLEDFSHQRLRGRQVYARDNSYREDKERERRDREMTARAAREQAAERTRTASREWAEKQRLREAARRQSLRVSGQASQR